MEGNDQVISGKRLLPLFGFGLIIFMVIGILITWAIGQTALPYFARPSKDHFLIFGLGFFAVMVVSNVVIWAVCRATVAYFEKKAKNSLPTEAQESPRPKSR